MSETWTKRRVDRDGYREWRIVAGDPESGTLIAQDMTEADADAILRDHEKAALLFYVENDHGWFYADLGDFHMPLKIAEGAYADEAKLRAAIDALNVAQDTLR